MLHARTVRHDLNVLRLKQAVPITWFTTRTGLPIETIAGKLNEAEKMGLLRWDAEMIFVEEKGHQYLNELLEMFLNQV